MRVPMYSALMRTTSKFANMGMFDSIMGKNWMGQNDDKSGGGDQQRQQPQQKLGADGKPLPPENDGANDDSSDDKIVDNIFSEDDKSKKNDAIVDPNAAPQNQPAPDPEKQVADYLKGVGLAPIKLTEAQLEAFKSGDGVQEVLDNLNQQIAQGHLSAVSSAQKLISKQVKDAVAEAVGSSATLLRDDKARDALRTAMPWASKPAFAPMAETILEKFLKKSNNDIPRAVKLTQLYFQQQMQEMDPDAQVNMNTSGNNRKARTPQNPGDTNWISVLTGKE